MSRQRRQHPAPAACTSSLHQQPAPVGTHAVLRRAHLGRVTGGDQLLAMAAAQTKCSRVWSGWPLITFLLCLRNR
jgi:hypothetical protein